MTQRKSKPKEDPARQNSPQEEEKPNSTEEELDKALADSFPASDPPAPAIKGTTANPMPNEKDNAGKNGR